MSSWDAGNTEMTKIQFLFLRSSGRDECANGYIYIYIYRERERERAYILLRKGIVADDRREKGKLLK